MKKTLFTVLKPLSFAPAIAMMIMIWHFSAQPGETSSQLSYEVSFSLVDAKNHLFQTGYTQEELYWQAQGIHYYIRKAAHVAEYMILAIAVSFPLYVYGIKGIRLLLLTALICISFAAFDEFHQSRVEARSPSRKDVGIDSIGVMLGALLVQAFCWSATHNPANRKKIREQ